MEQKAGHFHPEKFEDHYENALKDLLKKKQHGQKTEATKGKEPSNVIAKTVSRQERLSGGQRRST